MAMTEPGPGEEVCVHTQEGGGGWYLICNPAVAHVCSGQTAKAPCGYLHAAETELSLLSHLWPPLFEFQALPSISGGNSSLSYLASQEEDEYIAFSFPIFRMAA